MVARRATQHVQVRARVPQSGDVILLIELGEESRPLRSRARRAAHDPPRAVLGHVVPGRGVRLQRHVGHEARRASRHAAAGLERRARKERADRRLPIRSIPSRFHSPRRPDSTGSSRRCTPVSCRPLRSRAASSRDGPPWEGRLQSRLPASPDAANQDCPIALAFAKMLSFVSCVAAEMLRLTVRPSSW